MFELLTISDYCNGKIEFKKIMKNMTKNNGMSAYIFKQDKPGKKREGKVHLYNCGKHFSNSGRMSMNITPDGKYLFIANNEHDVKEKKTFKCSTAKNESSHYSFSNTSEIVKWKIENGGATFKVLNLDPGVNTWFGYYPDQQILIVLLDERIDNNALKENLKNNLQTPLSVTEKEEVKDVTNQLAEAIIRFANKVLKK